MLSAYAPYPFVEKRRAQQSKRASQNRVMRRQLRAMHAPHPVRLPARLSVCLCVCLSVCLPACLPACPGDSERGLKKKAECSERHHLRLCSVPRSRSIIDSSPHRSALGHWLTRLGRVGTKNTHASSSSRSAAADGNVSITRTRFVVRPPPPQRQNKPATVDRDSSPPAASRSRPGASQSRGGSPVASQVA